MSVCATLARLFPLSILAVGIAIGVSAAESPFAIFKKVVSLPETEREAAMTQFKFSSERKRNIVLSKVREYSALPETERNRKLDVLDFRWHLLPLMKAPKAERGDRLASVPERFRNYIERRLDGWDKLDSGVRLELLRNESFLRYLSSFGRGRHSRVAMTNHIGQMPPRLKEGIEGKITAWREKPKTDRRRMTRQFHRFFDLPSKEQERALRQLSRRERERMESSLAQFKVMTPAQRELVVRSFDKLANMSQAERAAFFRNTERWKGLTEVERKTWRTLVNKMPPLPPGFGNEVQPPMPPGLIDESVPVQTIVTNTIR